VTFADLGSAEITYWRLAVDQNNVYFVAGPDDELMKLSKAGGKPVALAKTFLPSNPVSDGADVYWFDALSGVQKLSLAGGEAVTIGECEKGAAVAVDSANIYCATELGKVLRFARADKAVTTVTTVENVPFDQVAVDDNNIYAVSVISGIYRIPKGGGRAEKLVPVDHQLVNFAIDASKLYWTNYDQGTVTQLAK
ncbi:MAG TPA: hypothetical protein VFU37_08220, partial [Pyrinomonadaceae bacterium]|nr:hypothetical protein [Pyrinomonadaceae bacterium]